MSADIAHNKEVIREKFDSYLDEMLGTQSVAYREFVEGHLFTGWKREEKLENVYSAMKQQRDILLDYAAQRATCADDATILQDADAVLDPSQSCDINTYQQVNKFLRTNPFLTEFSIDESVKPAVRSTLAEHFFYVSRELEELLDTETPADADDEFGALLRGTYDSYEAALEALEENFSYTSKLQQYKANIDLGWVGKLSNTSFSRDVWPVLKEGERELSERIERELKAIYQQ